MRDERPLKKKLGFIKTLIEQKLMSFTITANRYHRTFEDAAISVKLIYN